MKTQKQNSKGLYLQKRNSRWKWMAGATAATAAGVTASQASTITINLVGNYISNPGGDHLNADLTGDGHPDLTIASAFTFRSQLSFTFSHHYHYYRWAVGVSLNGIQAYAEFSNESAGQSARLGSKGGYYVTGSIPIFFKDLRINGGVPTRGSLEVTVEALGSPVVSLDSFTYNTAGQSTSVATVPDEGSSLALLAMGAGGVLALRRWRAAQGRS
jgi:hypothetical protein